MASVDRLRWLRTGIDASLVSASASVRACRVAGPVARRRRCRWRGRRRRWRGRRRPRGRRPRRPRPRARPAGRSRRASAGTGPGPTRRRRRGTRTAARRPVRSSARTARARTDAVDQQHRLAVRQPEVEQAVVDVLAVRAERRAPLGEPPDDDPERVDDRDAEDEQRHGDLGRPQDRTARPACSRRTGRRWSRRRSSPGGSSSAGTRAARRPARSTGPRSAAGRPGSRG